MPAHEPAPPLPKPSRTSAPTGILAAMLCLAGGIFVAYFLVFDLNVARIWQPRVATIVALGQPRGGRGGPYFPARLQVQAHDGNPLYRRAERDLTLPWRWSWSEPRRYPQPGDRVEVYVEPGPPYRVMPADRLTNIWAAPLLTLLMLIFPALLLVLSVQWWREATRGPNRHRRADREG
jgi:hypothetical protein